MKVLIIEPTWSGSGHLPANLGLLQIVGLAYPDSKIFYIGERTQIALIKTMLPANLIAIIEFIEWQVKLDKDTLPTDVFASYKKIDNLPQNLLRTADIIVLASCTATILTPLCLMGFASKTLAVLHGNANDLTGWRSRNPLRRLFDLKASLKRFCKYGGTALVLEERIKRQLSELFPWIASNIQCLPHALVTDEAVGTTPRHLSLPIRIGFAGLATIAKGFPDFLKLAHELSERRAGDFEFYAFGKLHRECENENQSVLKIQAGPTGLPRDSFIGGLKRMHYIFVWHQDNYYSNAASGVVYDAINLGIPLIARHSAQISEWEKSGINVASSHNNHDTMRDWLLSLPSEQESIRYKNQSENLGLLREELSTPKLAVKFLTITESLKKDT